MIVMDHMGPEHGFASTPSGRPRYVLGFIDGFSRYLITEVVTSTDDASTLKALVNLRYALSGLPDIVQCDNAILKSNSAAAKFLGEHNVAIRHGLPTVSRNQSAIERAFLTLRQLINKLHTDQPSTTYEQLVREATVIHNCSKNDSLPHYQTPKCLHFTHSPRNFLQLNIEDDGGPKKYRDVRERCQKAERAALEHQVESFLRRRVEEAPTDFSRRLRAGDMTLKKRTSFPVGVPKKHCHKVALDGFEVVSRCATNTFLCRSVMNGAEIVLPGDLLVRLRGHDVHSLRRLVESMIEATTKTERREQRRLTRHSNALDAQRNVAMISLNFRDAGKVKRHTFESLVDYVQLWQ